MSRQSLQRHMVLMSRSSYSPRSSTSLCKVVMEVLFRSEGSQSLQLQPLQRHVDVQVLVVPSSSTSLCGDWRA